MNPDISIWECYADKHQPICVANINDGGLSVNLYTDTQGAIIGVVAHDGLVEIGRLGLTPPPGET